MRTSTGRIPCHENHRAAFPRRCSPAPVSADLTPPREEGRGSRQLQRRPVTDTPVTTDKQAGKALARASEGPDWAGEAGRALQMGLPCPAAALAAADCLPPAGSQDAALEMLGGGRDVWTHVCTPACQGAEDRRRGPALDERGRGTKRRRGRELRREGRPRPRGSLVLSDICGLSQPLSPSTSRISSGRTDSSGHISIGDGGCQGAEAMTPGGEAGSLNCSAAPAWHKEACAGCPPGRGEGGAPSQAPPKF